jgi:hypothetical protein
MSQDRPCKRCIKRNIGHLCHDEPREGHGYHKKSKADSDATGADDTSPNKDDYATATPNLGPPALMDDAGQNLMQDDNLGMRQPTDAPMASSNPSAPAQPGGINGSNQSRKSSSLTLIDAD